MEALLAALRVEHAKRMAFWAVWTGTVCLSAVELVAMSPLAMARPAWPRLLMSLPWAAACAATVMLPAALSATDAGREATNTLVRALFSTGWAVGCACLSGPVFGFCFRRCMDTLLKPEGSAVLASEEAHVLSPVAGLAAALTFAGLLTRGSGRCLLVDDVLASPLNDLAALVASATAFSLVSAWPAPVLLGVLKICSWRAGVKVHLLDVLQHGYFVFVVVALYLFSAAYASDSVKVVLSQRLDFGKMQARSSRRRAFLSDEDFTGCDFVIAGLQLGWGDTLKGAKSKAEKFARRNGMHGSSYAPVDLVPSWSGSAARPSNAHQWEVHVFRQKAVAKLLLTDRLERVLVGPPMLRAERDPMRLPFFPRAGYFRALAACDLSRIARHHPARRLELLEGGERWADVVSAGCAMIDACSVRLQLFAAFLSMDVLNDASTVLSALSGVTSHGGTVVSEHNPTAHMRWPAVEAMAQAKSYRQSLWQWEVLEVLRRQAPRVVRMCQRLAMQLLVARAPLEPLAAQEVLWCCEGLSLMLRQAQERAEDPGGVCRATVPAVLGSLVGLHLALKDYGHLYTRAAKALGRRLESGSNGAMSLELHALSVAVDEGVQRVVEGFRDLMEVWHFPEPYAAELQGRLARLQ